MFQLNLRRLSKQSHIVQSIFTKQPSSIKKTHGSIENKLVCLCEKVAVNNNKRIAHIHFAPFDAAIL